jgi:penicillin amidase
VVFKYLQAWDLSGDLSDLDTTLLIQKLPPEMYAELYPNATMGEPFVPPIIQEFKALESAEPSPLVNSIMALKTLEASRPHIFGSPDEGAGSNNWAVNGSKSKTGTPLLAGDPHLGYQQPSLWYEVQMISDEGYNCTGVTFPAAPVILIGHNDRIAWSLTNVGGDSHVDFYEEKLNANGTQYYFDGVWRPLKTYTEVINVKGGPSESIVVRETVHGPLITDHNLVTDLTGTGFANLSLKWTSTSADLKLGENYSNEFKGLYLMNKATDFASFNEGLRWFGAMQNAVYADENGNIAMTVCGPFPIRKQGVAGTPDGNLKGNVVQNGTGIGEEWAGFIPFNTLPREINPRRCWVASSNQLSIAGINYSYYIGQNTFDDGYRARRIKALLDAKDNHTVADFEAYQGDNYDVSASQFLPILISAWNYSVNVQGKTYDQTVKEAMNILYGWDYAVKKTSTAPTIYDKWLEFFQSNTWDEFTAYGAGSLRKPMITILENLTKFQPNSKWFDDNSTSPTVESRNYTMLLSLNDTIAWLEASYGAMANWVWGNHHKIYVEHITGLSALSSPKIPLDGGPNLINNQWQTGGPSWRMVVNLGTTASADFSEEVYPGGQSGNPMSTHYLDLFYLYINYQYHPVYRSTVPFTALEATWVFTP